MSYIQNFSNRTASAIPNISAATATVYRDMYGWMAGGLGISALTALFVIQQATSSPTFAALYFNNLTMWGLAIVSFLIVIGLNTMINRLTFAAASLIFVLYSIIMGAWIAPILLVYSGASIAKVFIISAGTFGGMAIYGHATKRDLSSTGKICIMALWGVILASIVNIFVHSSMMDYILSYVGVVLFCGITMYDVQKLKNIINNYGCNVDDNVRKIALIGALSLYIDFLNLFLYLLRILGKRR